MSAILPNLDHFMYTDYEHFYEPAEDTYLLCDALLQDLCDLDQEYGYSCLEVGCGSGTVITYLGTLFREKYNNNCYLMATDINMRAAQATKLTAKSNNLNVDVVLTDLVESLTSISPHFPLHSIDICVFNPPYVPTDDSEVIPGSMVHVTDPEAMIAAAWAGGLHGRLVIDKFLPLISKFLRKPHVDNNGMRTPSGRCYMVLVEENKPQEIISILSAYELEAKIILSNRAKNELLHILRVTHKCP